MINVEPTKSSDTKQAYQKRALQLANKYRSETGLVWQKDPSSWVDWLTNKRPELKKSSWRQYKASVSYLLELHDDGNNDELANAREALDSVSQENCCKKSRKTSATRLKNLSDNDLMMIVNSLKPDIKKCDRLLVVWLNAGRIAGLRPHEWWQASMDGSILTVKNSKNTNGRANGDYRQIELIGIPNGALAYIKLMLKLVRDEWPVYLTAYNAAGSRLKRVTKRLWPKRHRRPTLYSARHQFRANGASAGLSLEILGALMGHNSTETARRHYGRKRYGSGIFKVGLGPDTLLPERTNSPLTTTGPSP